MGRREGRRAKRFPGVQDLGNEEYRIRAEWTCRKTSRRRELDRVITASSMAAAAAVRAQLLTEASEGTTPGAAERQRLVSFAASWSTAKRPSWAPSTRKTIAEVLDLHLLPVLGNYWLDALEETDLAHLRDAWAREEREVPGRDDKPARIPISPATVNTRLRIAKQVLHAAYRRRLMPRDICEDVAPLTERQRDADEEAASLTADELRALLAEMKRSYPSWYPMVAVMAWTGLRFGEASELRWSDFDAGANTLKVTRAQWHRKVSTPKTEAGARVVPLDVDAIAALQAQRLALASRNAPVLGAALIFPAKKGGHLWATYIAPVMSDVLRVIGVTRRLDPNHVFRHTLNDLVRRVTSEAVRQAIIGHASAESGEPYTDVRLEERRAAIAAVARLVRGE